MISHLQAIAKLGAVADPGVRMVEGDALFMVGTMAVMVMIIVVVIMMCRCRRPGRQQSSSMRRCDVYLIEYPFLTLPLGMLHGRFLSRLDSRIVSHLNFSQLPLGRQSEPFFPCEQVKSELQRLAKLTQDFVSHMDDVLPGH